MILFIFCDRNCEMQFRESIVVAICIAAALCRIYALKNKLYNTFAVSTRTHSGKRLPLYILSTMNYCQLGKINVIDFNYI